MEKVGWQLQHGVSKLCAHTLLHIHSVDMGEPLSCSCSQLYGLVVAATSVVVLLVNTNGLKEDIKENKKALTEGMQENRKAISELTATMHAFMISSVASTEFQKGKQVATESFIKAWLEDRAAQ